MAVKIINRQYRNQFHTSSESTDWLLGNVGDWQQLQLTVEVTVDFIANQQNPVTFDIENKTLVLNNGAKWSDYGFDIGDVIAFSITRDITDPEDSDDVESTTYNATIVIRNQYNDTIEFDNNFNSRVLPSGSYPTDRGTQRYYDVKFVSQKAPEGVKLQYSHLTNEDFDSDNLSSLIDGSIPEFSFAGLNTLSQGVITEMNPDGFQSGMAIDSAFVRVNAMNGDAHVYDFFINFMMGQFFETPSDLENMMAPSTLFDAASLTDNFLLRVFPEWNNPNTVITNDLDHTERLGNTGWFSENFNGLDNNFNID